MIKKLIIKLRLAILNFELQLVEDHLRSILRDRIHGPYQNNGEEFTRMYKLTVERIDSLKEKIHLVNNPIDSENQ